jgi:hypothetical protein
MLFPPIFVAVYLTHIALLRLPYYWDEAGYYIPAAYDFFRTGSLIPTSTLSNAHPPLPSIYLALWWHASGYSPAVTRVAMCFVAAVALLGVYRLAVVLTGKSQVAVATVILTGLYPVWFAQSTLAQADMFAAAGTLWALAFLFEAVSSTEPRRWRLPAAALCFTLAALSKETAIVTPLALGAWEAWLGLREPQARRRHALSAAVLATPVLPLMAWYAWHYHRTGYVFGNPEYLRYNATATVIPLRIAAALAHRLLHITVHMNLFVPILCMCAAMMLVPLKERDGSIREAIAHAQQARIYLVIGANLVLFSVLGGALLTRYLLPLYPLVLVICVNTFRRRVRYWQGLVALSMVGFLAGLFVNPPYRFAPEDNLAYRDVILLHKAAIREIFEHYPQATILTAWPASDELTKPELGYVRRPFHVVRIDNFSLAEIQKAAQQTEPYTVALVFSTKYDPPRLPFSLGPRNEALDERYFDFHRDLPPDAIAHLLGGTVVWHDEVKGQWSAVLHLDRPQEARLDFYRRPTER